MTCIVNLARTVDYPKPTKREEYQYVSGVMVIAYNPFLDSEAGNSYMKFEVAELLKFWTDIIIEIDPTERERPSLDLSLEKMPEVIRVPCSKNRVELKMGNGNEILITNLGTLRADSGRMLCEHHVNIATALGFFSRMCSFQSPLEMLESEHHLVTALSVESWPGVLQMVQKHIGGWKIGLEPEIGFPVSEAYSLPMGAKFLVRLVMAKLYGTHYPLHMAMLEASSQRVLINKAFSIPKCVRLPQMSHHSHRLLKKILGAVPGNQRENLGEIWGEELLRLESENTSDFERQNTIGKAMNSAPAMEENDVTHEK